MAEEADEEVEAAIAVYGADCSVIQRSPPHLMVRLKPRTAEDISKQFVEAVLLLKTNSEYPQTPPMLELRETKGLEEGKADRLLSELEGLANELISSPMLVAICEAALDKLTDMNQPDGNCCFCMCPLDAEDASSDSSRFMKLISCFHCFHSHCFGRWLQWTLQERGLNNTLEQIHEADENLRNHEKILQDLDVKCPVCRKPVNAAELASVWDVLLIESVTKQLEDHSLVAEPEVVFSTSELERKSKFDEIFKAQQQCGGIIEPKKLEVLVPGMFLPVPVSQIPSTSISEPSDSAIKSRDEEVSEPSVSNSVNTEPVVKEVNDMGVGRHLSIDSGGAEPPRSSNGRFRQKPHRRGRPSNHVGPGKGLWVKRNQDRSS